MNEFSLGGWLILSNEFCRRIEGDGGDPLKEFCNLSNDLSRILLCGDSDLSNELGDLSKELSRRRSIFSRAGTGGKLPGK